jgi:5'-AMP-activated protein kinase catalytic alpha subunit
VAVHEPTGHKVAIKGVNREKLENRALREIEILKLFNHPHIIRLYEVIWTSQEVYLVIEYVPGGELFEYLTTAGRLSINEARRIFQEIMSAVEYCHAQRVVHRDL